MEMCILCGQSDGGEPQRSGYRRHHETHPSRQFHGLLHFWDAHPGPNGYEDNPVARSLSRRQCSDALTPGEVTLSAGPRRGRPRSCKNRHRGSGHPLSPATPPDMRVRIGRFRGLRRAIEESRKAERVEVGDGKRVRQGRALRQVPGAVWTARRLRGEIFADS